MSVDMSIASRPGFAGVYVQDVRVSGTDVMPYSFASVEDDKGRRGIGMTRSRGGSEDVLASEDTMREMDLQNEGWT